MLKRIYALAAWLCLCLHLTAQQGGYPLKFQFKDANNQLHDTLMNRMRFKSWAAQESFPGYLQWKSQPFAVQKSTIHGLGLFADSLHTFFTGDTVCVLFTQRSTTGYFELDYLQTNPGSFINDSQQANTEAVISTQKIVLLAKQNISAGAEITLDYRQLLGLFGNDNQSAARVIKYW